MIPDDEQNVGTLTKVFQDAVVEHHQIKDVQRFEEDKPILVERSQIIGETGESVDNESLRKTKKRDQDYPEKKMND